MSIKSMEADAKKEHDRLTTELQTLLRRKEEIESGIQQTLQEIEAQIAVIEKQRKVAYDKLIRARLATGVISRY